jgi:hypothetical protein
VRFGIIDYFRFALAGSATAPSARASTPPITGSQKAVLKDQAAGEMDVQHHQERHGGGIPSPDAGDERQPGRQLAKEHEPREHRRPRDADAFEVDAIPGVGVFQVPGQPTRERRRIGQPADFGQAFEQEEYAEQHTQGPKAARLWTAARHASELISAAHERRRDRRSVGTLAAGYGTTTITSLLAGPAPPAPSAFTRT